MPRIVSNTRAPQADQRASSAMWIRPAMRYRSTQPKSDRSSTNDIGSPGLLSRASSPWPRSCNQGLRSPPHPRARHTRVTTDKAQHDPSGPLRPQSLPHRAMPMRAAMKRKLCTRPRGAVRRCPIRPPKHPSVARGRLSSEDSGALNANGLGPWQRQHSYRRNRAHPSRRPPRSARMSHLRANPEGILNCRHKQHSAATKTHDPQIRSVEAFAGENRSALRRGVNQFERPAPPGRVTSASEAEVSSLAGPEASTHHSPQISTTRCPTSPRQAPIAMGRRPVGRAHGPETDCETGRSETPDPCTLASML